MGAYRSFSGIDLCYVILLHEMSSSLKKRASNERMTSQSHILGGPVQNGPLLSVEPMSYAYGGQDSGALHQPRSSATDTYPASSTSTMTHDTALREYSSSSSAYAPNGYISSRGPNGPSRYPNSNTHYPPPHSHPPPPPQPPGRSTTLPPVTNGLPPRARHVYSNASLSPTYSPTSRSFARRGDSPPASTYFTASPSSQHRLTPTPGHAHDLGDHFSFSTTLRRHTLGAADDMLPFSGGRGASSFGRDAESIEDRFRAFARPLAQKIGLETLLFPRREDEELNGTEHGYGLQEREPATPTLDPSARRDTESGRYAAMASKVSKHALIILYFRAQAFCGYDGTGNCQLLSDRSQNWIARIINNISARNSRVQRVQRCAQAFHAPEIRRNHL